MAPLIIAGLIGLLDFAGISFEARRFLVKRTKCVAEREARHFERRKLAGRSQREAMNPTA